MSKMTFVLEFEDGQEPPIQFTEDFFGTGGRLCSAAIFDYKDDFLTEKECALLEDALNSFMAYDDYPDVDVDKLPHKMSLITQ